MCNKGLEAEFWGDHNWGSHWFVVCCSILTDAVGGTNLQWDVWLYVVSDVFTALLLEIKSLVTLCHWTVVPNILKECNAIKILGAIYTVPCARRLESSYPAYLYRVVVIISLLSKIFHSSPKHHIWMRNVHAPYVGVSILISQPADQLICMKVSVFPLVTPGSLWQSVWNWPCPLPNPFHFIICWHYSETLTASINKRNIHGYFITPTINLAVCQLPI
jgi:hypothetical protein